MCGIVYVLWGRWCVVCGMKYAGCGTGCVMCGRWCAVCGMRCGVGGVCWVVCGVQHVVYGVWRTVWSLRCVADLNGVLSATSPSCVSPCDDDVSATGLSTTSRLPPLLASMTLSPALIIRSLLRTPSTQRTRLCPIRLHYASLAMCHW